MKKLPLPSPRSPKGLDEKIMAYAKQKQPEKKTYRPPLWLSGLATASIVLVTVMITLPTQQRVGSTDTESAQPAAGRAKATLSSPKSIDHRKPSVDRYEMAPQAASARSALPELAADEAAEDLDADWVHHRLEQLAEQLKNEDSSLARRNYEALKHQCTECGLPATLEAALEKYLPGD
jgi:hypothetical protein